MNRLTADLLLLAAAAIWGLAFVFQKTAMQAVGPFTFIAARSIVATLALAPLAALEWRWLAARPISASSPAAAVQSVRLPASMPRSATIAGLAFFVAAALQQVGLETATATNAGFLTALYVVATPLLAWGLRGVRPGPMLLPAVFLSAVGTWLLGGGTFDALTRGDWLVVACAGVWALHVILSKDGAALGRPVLFTCLQFAVVAIASGLAALALEHPSVAGIWTARGEILYVGMLSSALTFTILTAALEHAPASEAAVIVGTESLFAALAGAVFLGERLIPAAWIGAALIVASVIVVQTAAKPATRSPAPAPDRV